MKSLMPLEKELLISSLLLVKYQAMVRTMRSFNEFIQGQLKFDITEHLF